ncbi:MAG: septum formation initiator family protein [Patescibacteria group bacterium]|nr:septum formation initiator family protein [Patescibacteria group bacterium]
MFVARQIILGILTVFFLVSLTRNLFEYKKNLAFYESYRKSYEETVQRNNELKSQLVKSQDVHELEKTIRNQLNLSRKNEVAVLLPPPSPTPVVITPTPQPNWYRWYQILSGVQPPAGARD